MLHFDANFLIYSGSQTSTIPRRPSSRLSFASHPEKTICLLFQIVSNANAGHPSSIRAKTSRKVPASGYTQASERASASAAAARLRDSHREHPTRLIISNQRSKRGKTLENVTNLWNSMYRVFSLETVHRFISLSAPFRWTNSFLFFVFLFT